MTTKTSQESVPEISVSDHKPEPEPQAGLGKIPLTQETPSTVAQEDEHEPTVTCLQTRGFSSWYGLYMGPYGRAQAVALGDMDGGAPLLQTPPDISPRVLLPSLLR